MPKSHVIIKAEIMERVIYMESNEENKEKKEYQKEGEKQKTKRGIFPMVTSGLIGGVISAVLITALFLMNIIPNEQAMNENSSSDETTSHAVTTMSDVNIDSDANIDQLEQAIVGVINKQQQNIWENGEDAGSGSGIIYKKEDGKAYVVTNNHVVQNAKQVEVDVNGERVEAEVKGTDELNDLAVLEIDASNVEEVANLGTSDELKVGETVIAIGNPLGMEFAGSVTKGIVSGLDRAVEIDTNGDGQADWVTEVLQTDAAINPGNSGGALANASGEVIGINSMKIADQGVEGIGFAIPIDTALPIIDQLENDGEVTRPFIGISTAELEQVPAEYRNEIKLPEDVKNGMVIANVQENSPAGEAGLQQFDVITKINDQEINSLLDLRKFLYSETKVGDTIKMEVYHDGKKGTVEIQLTEKEE